MKAIWIPPKLCDCRLELDADWLEGTVDNGQAYAHPKQYSVTSVNIVNTCSEHQHVLNEPYQPEPHGRPGYMAHLVKDPTQATEAQKLYQYLTRYTGIKTSQNEMCACEIYICNEGVSIDPITKQNLFSEEIMPHPLHTRKCDIHVDDDDVHSQFFADSKTYADTKKELLKNPDLTKNKYGFDEDTGEIVVKEITLDPEKVTVGLHPSGGVSISVTDKSVVIDTSNLKNVSIT